MNNKRVYFGKKFQVASYDIDFLNRLKLESFFNYLQEAAGEHAERFGIGYNYLKSEGLFWVLSRIKLIIDRYPRVGDWVDVITWPKDFRKLFAVRDFLVKDSSGSEIAYATSYWLLINSNSRRPRKDVNSLGFPLLRNKDSIKEHLEKINPVENLQTVYERKVLYSDIDVNRHVNNAKYVEWICDCFPESFYENELIRSIEVNYIAEAKTGDIVVLKKSSNDYIYVEGCSKANSDRLFAAKISVKPGTVA